jgi:putative transposase
MTDAYHAGLPLEAEATLLALAKQLDRTHPGAAASLREGLDETLTVVRLGVPPTLRSTNAIEFVVNMRTTSNAGGTGEWRCAGARPGLVEAGKQFRRVNGHLHSGQRSNANSPNLSDLPCTQ